MLFNPANLPYWIFLSLGIFLFLAVIISGSSESDSDLDSDIETDPQLDPDTPISILGWIGVGEAPLLLLLATDLSLWGLIGWILNLLIGNTLGNIPDRFFGIGGLILLTSLIFSLLIGKIITRPIGQIFASFGADASSDRLIGRIGTVSSATIPKETDRKIGQVDVYDQTQTLVTISANLPNWAQITPHRGDQVLILHKNQQTYQVIVKDSIDQYNWLQNLQNK